MAANYNRTAWFYDALSRFVFRNSIIKAQAALIKYIPPLSHLLIIGGGTGWILEKIAGQHQGLTITYVEVAPNMIALSKKRNYGNNQVTFINNEIEYFFLAPPANVVFTPFFFSNFAEKEVTSLFAHIDEQLKTGGIWLNADFQLGGRWWHKIMLQMMYAFFRVFGAVNNSRIFDITNTFATNNYQTIYSETFYGDFIIAAVRKKKIYL